MFKHVSVLLEETISYLNVKKDGIYVDCTLGGGGHAKEVLKKLDNGLLIGIDQDEDAIKAASENLSSFKNLVIEKNNFSNIKDILNKHNIEKVDGIYMDLGVSSFQLDEKEKGFSYHNEAPLDMRMDKDNKINASFVVNNFGVDELAKILYENADEKFSYAIAKNIVKYRENKKIETTTELADIVKESVPFSYKRDKHPAKKTFQALRIFVNDELNVLKKVLDDSIDLLNDGGRICCITFHSLEDRIVKESFKLFENPCTCPKGYPCVCGKVSKGKIITRHPIVPDDKEIEENNRARSAHLRVFERRY